VVVVVVVVVLVVDCSMETSGSIGDPGDGVVAQAASRNRPAAAIPERRTRACLGTVRDSSAMRVNGEWRR
jgi:hypothetical protein